MGGHFLNQLVTILLQIIYEDLNDSNTKHDDGQANINAGNYWIAKTPHKAIDDVIRQSINIAMIYNKNIDDTVCIVN